MTQIEVGLSEGRDYRIHIGAGALSQAGEVCAGVARSRRAVVLTQPRIAAAWGEPVRESLSAAGFHTELLTYPAGERFKTLTMVERLYEKLYHLALPVDRKTLVVALGGGVVGDMAGFVAASYLRGLDYVQIPTTLLAMVDSSVGGKTGVDFREGKNLIGAFHQPRAVVVDPTVLRTLPPREVRSGLAEVVKYGIIAEPELLTFVTENATALCRKESGAIAHVVARSCAIKAQVVTADEREETGLRAILNYGHTIGHALESATQYRRYKHGEAVAIGMTSAALIGEAGGVTPSGVTEVLDRALAALALPRFLPHDISDTALLALTARDKKAAAGQPQFVLAHQLGHVALQPVPSEVVLEGLHVHRLRGESG